MMGLVKFQVENNLKHLMQDEEFKRRILRAYRVQVEQNHGWGFTVRYKGYVIRFDDDGKTALATKGRVRVYIGYAVEKPTTKQATITAF